MKLDNMGDAVISSAVFAGIGLVVFALAFFLMTKLTPFSVRKEIEEDQNTALGDHHGRRDHRHLADHRRRRRRLTTR